MATLLVKNGTIVTATDLYRADIYVVDEKVKAIASDMEVSADKTIDATGCYVFPGGIDPRKMTEIRFEAPLPPGTIVSPLYLDYPGFRSIPKPDSYRAFFVMRDPRDILVSWYLSIKHYHP